MTSQAQSRFLVLRFEIDTIETSIVKIEQKDRPRVEKGRNYQSVPDFKGNSKHLLTHIKNILRTELDSYDESKRNSINACVISIPGATDENHRQLLRASRYGIFDPVNLGEELSDIFDMKTLIFNDCECIAKYEHSQLDSQPPLHLVLMAGYGIGSILILNNSIHRGAGHAGHLGRLPIAIFDGGYANVNPNSLEAFSSRLAIAQSLRRVYNSNTAALNEVQDEHSRDRLKACMDRMLAYKNPHEVRLEDIQDAIDFGDQTAPRIVDESARFLGMAIATAIIYISPHVITCVGDLFDGLKSYWPAVRYYSRQYSWPNAFESLTLRRGEAGHKSQFCGAGLLANDPIHF